MNIKSTKQKEKEIKLKYKGEKNTIVNKEKYIYSKNKQ